LKTLQNRLHHRTPSLTTLAEKQGPSMQAITRLMGVDIDAKTHESAAKLQ
jgi:hypothetical protein